MQFFFVKNCVAMAKLRKQYEQHKFATSVGVMLNTRNERLKRIFKNAEVCSIHVFLVYAYLSCPH